MPIGPYKAYRAYKSYHQKTMIMRNFDYLQELGLSDLHRFCSAAEEMQVSNPDLSAICARKALEYIVRSLYVMKNIEVPERASLIELVDGEVFREFIGDNRMMMAAHYVRKVGNNGAHNKKVTRGESFFCLLNIYNVVAAVLHKLNLIKDIVPFDRNLIPNSPQASVITPALSRQQIKRLSRTRPLSRKSHCLTYPRPRLANSTLT